MKRQKIKELIQLNQRTSSLKSQDDFFNSLNNLSVSFLPSQKMKNAIIILGKTGSGKSTIMNIIHERQVRAEYYKGKNVISVQGQSISKVYHESLSGTTEPIIFHDADQLFWIDNPGFFDSRGPKQEIINAMILQRIFEKTKYVKLLIMMEDFCTRQKNIEIKMLTQMLKPIFGNDILLGMERCVLLVTKGRLQKEDRLKIRLNSLVQELGQKNIQNFWQQLIDNRLCSFREYEPDEKIDYQAISKMIRVKINKAKFFSSSVAIISLSSDSVYYSGQCSIKLKDLVIDKLKKIGNQLNQFYHKQFLEQCSLRELSDIKLMFQRLLKLPNVIQINQIYVYFTEFLKICNSIFSFALSKRNNCLWKQQSKEKQSFEILLKLAKASQAIYFSINLEEIIGQNLRLIDKRINLIGNKWIRVNTCIGIDATGSMGNELNKILPIIEEAIVRAVNVLTSKGMKYNFSIMISVYRNYNSDFEEILESTNFENSSTNLKNFLRKIRSKGGCGNEAIQVFLQHVNKLSNVDQIFLIGDAGPNSPKKIDELREKYYCQSYWNSHGFPQTSIEKQMKSIIRKQIPIHSFYLKQAYKSFLAISNATRGQCRVFQINKNSAVDKLTLIILDNFSKIFDQKCSKNAWIQKKTFIEETLSNCLQM